MIKKGEEVILIEEDCHGLIGIAGSYEGAINCILDWNEEIPIINKISGKERPATEKEIEKIRKWNDIDKFNDAMCGLFSLSIDKLW